MTEQEYENIITHENAKISNLKKGISNANNIKDAATSKFIDTLGGRYSDFIGKKVELVFTITNCFGKSVKLRYIGFLEGFKESRYKKEIVPVLAKIKKDGSASANTYNDFDLYSYKLISDIKIIE